MQVILSQIIEKILCGYYENRSKIMTGTEKINEIKQLLKKYDFAFKEITVSQAMEEISYESFYNIAELISELFNFGNRLTEIVNEK